MRRKAVCAPMMTLLLLLTACGGGKGADSDQLALEIRAEYLAMNACTAAVEVHADYGRRVYDYTLVLDYAREGDTALTVTAPEEIAGITARISKGTASLEYDGMRLETGPMDDKGLSPVSAVPVLLDAVKEAFIAETAFETLEGAETLRVTCRDPEADPGTGRELTLWFDPAAHTLLRAEILSDGVRVIGCIFNGFTMA